VARLQSAAPRSRSSRRCGERFEADPILLSCDLFSAIREHVQRKLRRRRDAQAAEGDAQPVRRGPLGSRQDAVRQLGQVAAFFRETEPHSPVSYLVERAARWAALPLADLYREVVKSPEVLARIWETLGIEPPPENR
jgi:predicted component of type VI protein secretion system